MYLFYLKFYLTNDFYLQPWKQPLHPSSSFPIEQQSPAEKLLLSSTSLAHASPVHPSPAQSCLHFDGLPGDYVHWEVQILPPPGMAEVLQNQQSPISLLLTGTDAKSSY